MRSVLVASLILLAGCADAPEVTEAAPPPIPDIFGLVVDQDGEPLPNATVRVPGIDMENQTDEAGGFGFIIDTPGDHDVIATKDGYTVAQTRVTLAPGLAARIVFTLSDLATLPDEVFVDVFRALVPCTIQGPTGGTTCPGFPDDENFRTYRVPSDVGGEMLRGIVMEWLWEGPVAEIQVTVEDVTGTVAPIVLRGESGVRFEIEQAELEAQWAHRPDLRVTLSHVEDEPVAYQQEVEGFTSFFLNQPAADDYSIT